MNRLLSILLIVLSSCSPKLMVEQRDSTYTTIETQWRDSLITIGVPKEVNVGITDLSVPYVAATSLAEVEITPLDNGKYNVDLHHKDNARITTIVRIPTQQVTTVTTSLRKETVVKEVHTLRWWQKVLCYIGSGLLLYVIGRVILKVAKRFIV